MPKIVPFDDANMGYAIALGRELHGLGAFRDIPFHYDTITRNTKNAMRDPNWYCRIAHDDIEWCGIMVGHIDSFLFSPSLFATESMIYVRPDTKLRTRLAIRLMNGFMAWAIDERGATHIQSGDVAGINSVAVDAFYRHLGFSRFGSIYKYSRPGSVI